MGMTRRFTVQVAPHHGFTIDRVGVIVHDTLTQLRRSYNRLDTPSPCNAFCRPAPYRERYDKKTRTWVRVPEPRTGATVHYAKELLTTEIVVHELVHAALALYRINVKPIVNLGNGCRKGEETVAYLVGELTWQTTNRLHELDLWGG